MPIFYKRNVHSQKYRVLFLYFPIFHEKTTSLMPIFCWKNVHLQKTSCSYALFFPNFTKKLLLSCPYSVKKRSFSKKHAALMPIFCQKNVHSLKKRYSHLIFFNFFYEKPLLSCTYLIKIIVNSVNTTLYHGPKKSIRCSFFPIFHKKSLL